MKIKLTRQVTFNQAENSFQFTPFKTEIGSTYIELQVLSAIAMFIIFFICYRGEYWKKFVGNIII